MLIFLDFGNEEFMLDYTLSTDEVLTEAFGGTGIKSETPEQCQAECLGREKLCFGWTFDNFNEDTGKGSCVLNSAPICCNQNSKKKKKEGAVSGFACGSCKSCKSCWSTSGACPCEHDVHDLPPQFQAGGSDTVAFSPYVSQLLSSNIFGYNSSFFLY